MHATSSAVLCRTPHLGRMSLYSRSASVSFPGNTEQDIMPLKVVQRPPEAPKGDAEFEAFRQEILEAVAAKIPNELILPSELIDHPPLDVTGIPDSCGLLSEAELAITEDYDLVGLAEAIADGKLTSTAVTTAFCKRAIIAHQLTFCLTDLYMVEALDQAKKLDEHFARTGKPLGPLHGVPISIKEMVPVEGQVCSLGLRVTRHISEKDCVLVTLLREMGAVFYVKTHEPAAVFALEGVSGLGRTLNPHNIDLSPGGSSAGEGALLAMRGSVFGIGTDIGGSIRVPAIFSGLYGLKGSHGFWPVEGLLSGPFPAGLQIDGIIGPLSNSLRDIDYVNRHLRSRSPWLQDPEIIPTPYTGITEAGKDRASVKIAILRDYELMQPQPPSTEALDWAVKQLHNAGFKPTEYKFFEPARADRMYGTLMIPDRWKVVKGAMQAGNEPQYPIFDRLTSYAMSCDPDATEDHEETAMIVSEKRFARDQYRSAFLKDWIAQGDPDIVIAPVGPACPHDLGELRTATSCTHLWNLLDYPAIIVPTSIKAKKREAYNPEEYENVAPWTEADADVKKMWKEHNHEGAPIGLQIIAKRRHENELMQAVGLISEALKLK